MSAFLRRLPTPVLIGALLLLCIPAFLINLGLMAFNGDEAIRSLVALEMHLTGHYIATTMHGADYINKPPLFNWLVLAAMRLYGSFDSEWPSRLVTVTALTAFGFTTYRAAKTAFDKNTALLIAFSVVTSGRLLFYDAMLGLIDTTFSLCIYSLFLSLYFMGRSGKFLLLFTVSYALMALGFLLKGFPALVFQALSLPVALAFHRRLSLLFSWRHLAGIATAGFILGLYLVAYSAERPLEVFLPNLLHESVKRTAVEHGWLRMARHLVKFPFDSIYHFLPYSLFILFWMDKHLWNRIRQNGYVLFHFVMLAVNLPVYWTSVHVEPRYILMFIPLFNVIGFYLMRQHEAANSVSFRIFYTIPGLLLVLSSVAMPALPFITQISYLPGLTWIATALCVCLALCTFGYITDKQRFLFWFIAALLFIRIGFNLIVLPARHDESIVTRARRDVRALAEKYPRQEWYVYGDAYVREPLSFYLTARLGRIVPRTTDTSRTNAVYLVNPQAYPEFSPKPSDILQTDYPEIKTWVVKK